MVERISRETLQEKVYESIKDSILKNELMPGDVLSIDSLAEDLGVSPTPVREALAKLSAQGLVRNARNKKARVAPVAKEDVLQIYEVRKLLEPYASRLVAEQVEEKPNLEERLKDLRKQALEVQENGKSGSLHSEQYDHYVEIDLQLARVIEETLGETLLNKILCQVENHSLRIRSFTEATTDESFPGVVLANNQEHLEIIKAMLRSDPEGTERAVQNHLDNTQNRTLAALKSQSEDY